jgi:hypothetical protein
MLLDRRPRLLAGALSGLLYLSRADAGSANAQALGGAIDERVHRLQIQIPTPLAEVVSVANAVAKLRAAPAYIANSCHITKSPGNCETSILAAETATPQPNTLQPLRIDA